MCSSKSNDNQPGTTQLKQKKSHCFACAGVWALLLEIWLFWPETHHFPSSQIDCKLKVQLGLPGHTTCLWFVWVEPVCLNQGHQGMFEVEITVSVEANTYFSQERVFSYSRSEQVNFFFFLISMLLISIFLAAVWKDALPLPFFPLLLIFFFFLCSEDYELALPCTSCTLSKTGVYAWLTQCLFDFEHRAFCIHHSGMGYEQNHSLEAYLFVILKISPVFFLCVCDLNHLALKGVMDDKLLNAKKTTVHSRESVMSKICLWWLFYH